MRGLCGKFIGQFNKFLVDDGAINARVSGIARPGGPSDIVICWYSGDFVSL